MASAACSADFEKLAVPLYIAMDTCRFQRGRIIERSKRLPSLAQQWAASGPSLIYPLHRDQLEKKPHLS
jgi:hypothetical protein